MKKILIISPHFHPENFKCNEVAFELARRGYDVTALSDIPNYPSGKFFPGYGYFRRRREVVDGVKIIRTGVIPRGDGSGLRLALNYLSFAVTASIRAFFMACFHSYDAILVHESSPVTVGIPAVIIKKLRRRTRLLFWVLDLWPESLQAAGGINNKLVLNFFAAIARMCYKNSDRILMSSRSFRQSICEKGDFEDKLEYFPNWSDVTPEASCEYHLPEMPKGFILMFAGNIGEAQDFEHILKSALILKERGRDDIHFVLVGDGRKKAWVDDFVEKNDLSSMVQCVGRHPLETMGMFFRSADVLFLALKDSLIFNLTCPAKLQAYMSAGKPILAMLNGEGASIVRDAQCGFAVPAGDTAAMADMLERMSGMSREQLEEMGRNGSSYCEKNFSFAVNMKNLENWILEEQSVSIDN